MSESRSEANRQAIAESMASNSNENKSSKSLESENKKVETRETPDQTQFREGETLYDIYNIATSRNNSWHVGGEGLGSPNETFEPAVLKEMDDWDPTDKDFGDNMVQYAGLYFSKENWNQELIDQDYPIEIVNAIYATIEAAEKAQK